MTELTDDGITAFFKANFEGEELREFATELNAV